MKAWDCNGLALPSDAKIVGESEFESHLEPACVILFDHAPRFISDSSFLTSGAHETPMSLGTKALLRLGTLGFHVWLLNSSPRLLVSCVTVENGSWNMAITLR